MTTTKITNGILLTGQSENYSRLCQTGFIGFAESYKKQSLNPSIYAGMSFDDRISECITAQEEYVNNRQFQRILRNAKLPCNKTLDEIARDPSEGLSRDVLKSLTGTKWVERGINIAITGGCGVGKTTLACAIGIQVATLGLTVYYSRISVLLDWLNSKEGYVSENNAYNKLKSYQLLILDDFGTDRTFTSEDLTHLLRVADDHYNKNIIICSQYRTAGFLDLFPANVTSESVMDRLLRPCNEIALSGDSRRALIDNSLE